MDNERYRQFLNKISNPLTSSVSFNRGSNQQESTSKLDKALEAIKSNSSDNTNQFEDELDLDDYMTEEQIQESRALDADFRKSSEKYGEIEDTFEQSWADIDGSVQDIKRFNYLSQSYHDATKFTLKRLRSHDRVEDFKNILKIRKVGGDYDLRLAMEIASQVRGYMLLKEMEEISKKYHNDIAYQEYSDAAIFNDIGVPSVYVGTLRLIDIVTLPQGVQPDVVESIRYFVESQLGRLVYNDDGLKDLEKIASYNVDTYGFRNFPHRARHIYQNVERAIDVFTNISPRSFDKTINTSTHRSQVVVREAARWGKRIVEVIQSIRDNAFTVIMTPDDPQIDNLSTLLSNYLSEDRALSNAALNMIGLNSTLRIYQLYRFSREMAESDHQMSSFYIQLAEAIYKYASESSNLANILTHEDLMDIVDQDKVQEASNEELAFHTESIVEKLSNLPQLNILLNDPRAIGKNEWGPLLQPKQIKIDYKSKEGILTTAFYYENMSTSERLTFVISLNIATQNFNWSFLESTDEEEMKNIQNSFLSVIDNLLDQQIRKIVPTQTQITPKRKKTRFRDEIYDLRKEVRKSNATNGISKLIVDESVERVDENGPRRRIFVPLDVTENQILFGTLPVKDREQIKLAIQRFNERKTNYYPQFKQLKNLTHDGQKYFRLRVGQFRVMVIDTEDDYRIVDIDDRKNIYR
jgi:hypothetical protein